MKGHEKRLLNKLFPDIYVDTILDIPIEELAARGIRAFIIDLDNTTTHWNSNELTPEVREWFARLGSLGLKACFLSNNGEQRVLAVARSLDLPYVFRAQKPRRGGYRLAMEAMGSDTWCTAVIGDQIYTDILGGNRTGLLTILVKPIHTREFMGTKISRMFEGPVLRQIHRKQTNRGKRGDED